jgi:peptidoglycan/xylan/chitin deacetylase (PgdA/CDA1 family)
VRNISIKIITASILLLAFAAPSQAKNVYILCYHAFLEKKDPYTFTMDQFREQISTLKKNGFTFVRFEDVINGRITGDKNILITIDDGNHSVYEAYRAIMKPNGIKPALGIYPAIIGRRHYAMTWDQLKELSADGCYIASHGYHHMFLSEKYFKKDPASFKKEIYLSKKVLEEKLGRRIETMIYPFGVNSDTAISELKNAGYRYGMTIKAGMTALPITDNFKIHRYLMTKPSQKGTFASIMKDRSSRQSKATSGSQKNQKKKKSV